LHDGSKGVFLRDLQHDQSVLAKNTAGPNNLVVQTPYTSDPVLLNTKLAEVDTLKADVKKISDNFSTQFITKFNNLASICVAIAITSISIFIAVMVVISNVVINKAVKVAHAEEINKDDA
jgi:hypothetical protein